MTYSLCIWESTWSKCCGVPVLWGMFDEGHEGLWLHQACSSQCLVPRIAQTSQHPNHLYTLLGQKEIPKPFQSSPRCLRVHPSGKTARTRIWPCMAGTRAPRKTRRCVSPWSLMTAGHCMRAMEIQPDVLYCKITTTYNYPWLRSGGRFKNQTGSNRL